MTGFVRGCVASAAIVAAIGGGTLGSAAEAAADPMFSIPSSGYELIPLPVGTCIGTIHVSLESVATDARAVQVTASPTLGLANTGCRVVVRFFNLYGWEYEDLLMDGAPVSAVLHPGAGFQSISVIAVDPGMLWPAGMLLLR